MKCPVAFLNSRRGVHGKVLILQGFVEILAGGEIDPQIQTDEFKR
jgi:hypothetical protein